MTDPWTPANQTERALADAVSRGDQRGYFQLLAVCELYLPERAAARTRPGPQRFLTADLFGQRYLPVFTSVPALARAMHRQADAYALTSYPELRRKWPVPEWRLAVNPGTPIDAYVTVAAVEQAALGDVTVPTGAQLVTEARAAAGSSRTAGVDAYLRALLDADVIVPVAEPVDPERIVEPDFPWRPGGLAVFTSPAHLPERVGPTVTVPFLAVLVGWPGGDLLVDPGTAAELRIAADSVLALALWLPEAEQLTGGELT